jgi:tRNA threonylcarbamoyladenosine biosynthesis protein TsaE
MRCKQVQITTHSARETQKLGQTIGTWFNTPTIIALSGELGSGKTAFVQGLAKGLDVPPNYYITSPTFTLINQYPGRYPLFHVDLYRIENTVELDEIGLDEILHQDGVIAIEWADKLAEHGLSAQLAIHFDIIGEETRKINLVAYGHQTGNLIKTLQNSVEAGFL